MTEFSGHLRLRAAPREDGRTILAEQSFRAPFHLSKPYWDPDAHTLIVQVVNPTAGLLAGDRLESAIQVDPGAAIAVTTPSASRVFQMRSGQAVSQQAFTVAAGGWLEVLPEPLVPHRGSVFHQETRIDVASGGGLFFVDQLMPGRLGHEEAWQWKHLVLHTEVRIGGSLALRERLCVSGGELRELAAFFGFGSAGCFANAILIPPESGSAPPAWLSTLRALHRPDLWVGVSALRQGGWSLRIAAKGPLHLRDGLRSVRAVLAAHFPRLGADLRKL